MRIELKKTRDQRPSLACVRDDGTRSWSRLHPFFPVHDLTHCAVESVFGFTEAFFGLVAAGRDLADFQQPGASAWLPAEAMWAESMVGLFDMERGSGQLLSAAEFNTQLAAGLAQGGIAPFRAVSDEELGRVRTLRAQLTARWNATAPGDTLSVPFPAVSGEPSRPAAQAAPRRR